MGSSLRRLGVAVAAGAFGVLAWAASPALAAQSTQTASCSNGQTYTVRTVASSSSQNGGWGTAVIIAGGSGVGTPTSFNAAVFDNTVGQTLFTFSSVKGGGNANQSQQMTQCTVTIEGTVADFVAPGTQLPPGVSGTDSATETIDVTVVLKP